MVKIIKGWAIINSVIYECEMQINWINNIAMLKKVAGGKQYENIAVPETNWSLTVDRAMHIALKQAEKAYRDALPVDPALASTWEPLIKDYKFGNYIINRF